MQHHSCLQPATGNPVVSIIMTAYKQASFIEESIRSVLSQTYKNWELVIVDDGSPDNVGEVVRPFAEKDDRIKFYHTENHGVSAARNFGVGHSCGDFILPLDADDVIKESYIEECLTMFREFPDAKVVYCQWEYFGVTTATPPLSYKGYKNLLLDNSIFNTAMFRRSDWSRIGGWDEKIMVGREDWEFWIRLLDEDAVVVQIQKPLFRYRIKEQSRNVTAKTREATFSTDDYVYCKHNALYRKFFGGSAIDNIKYRERMLGEHPKPLFSRIWRAALKRE